MLAAILSRLLRMVVVMFGISVITFLIFFATPGADPAARIAGRNAAPETVAAVRHDFGLDQPIWVQYGLMMQRLGVIDRAHRANRAPEQSLCHVEAVARNVADRPAHLGPVGATPCGGLGGVEAIGELHVEAGVVDDAEPSAFDQFARLFVERVVEHHVVNRHAESFLCRKLNQHARVARV